ncbi:hypothetical protein ABBQ38_012242 [Trebouxia sp. C0009 RCD-2024]
MLCLHHSLATMAPEVAHYWDVTKNDVSPEPSQRVGWQQFQGQTEMCRVQVMNDKRLLESTCCKACSFEGRLPQVVTPAKSSSLSLPLPSLSLQCWLKETICTMRERNCVQRVSTLGSNKLVH